MDFPSDSVLNNPPAMEEMQETWVWSLGREYTLEGMATHSSNLARRIPRTEEPGGLQSVGSQRVGHNWETEHRYFYRWIFTLLARRKAKPFGIYMRCADKNSLFHPRKAMAKAAWPPVPLHTTYYTPVFQSCSEVGVRGMSSYINRAFYLSPADKLYEMMSTQYLLLNLPSHWLFAPSTKEHREIIESPGKAR